MAKAYFKYSTNNIGDDMQTLALEEVFGKPDLYLDRDKLNEYADDGDIDLYANAFMTCGEFPPPPNINPFFVSLGIYALARPLASVEYLKKHFVGCRDHHSAKWCSNNGIKNVFVGCPTILMKSPQLYNREGCVTIVDVNPALLRDGLKHTTNIKWYTNNWEFGDNDHEGRFSECKKRKSILANSSLVITSRIHVAMPAIAMGIPTIMVAGQSTIFPHRLGALPPWVKIYNQEQIGALRLDDPSEFLCDQSLLLEWQSDMTQKLAEFWGLGVI